MSVVTVTCTILDSSGAVVPDANIVFQLVRNASTPDGVLLSTRVTVTADSSGVATVQLYPYAYCNSPYNVYISSPDDQYHANGTAYVLSADCTLDEIFQANGNPATSLLETSVTECQQAVTTVLSNASFVSAHSASAQESASNAALSAAAALSSELASNLSATSAAQSEAAAAASAAAANTAAENAFTWGTAAQGAVAEAEGYASNATLSATAAAGSASTATTEAGTATTQAGNAASSASSASSSASTATTQAGLAGTYAANAHASASNANLSSIAAANYASALFTTSTTSLTIGTGTQTLTVPAGLQFKAGQYVLIYETATPSNWMTSQVTNYSGTSLVVSVTYVNGSGTSSAWSVSLAGAPNPSVTLQSQANNTLLGNVSGSSSAPSALTVSQVQTLLGAGSANGLATLDSTGSIPATQLKNSPSYLVTELMFWSGGY
jgi:hypothetical protein